MPLSRFKPRPKSRLPGAPFRNKARRVPATPPRVTPAGARKPLLRPILATFRPGVQAATPFVLRAGGVALASVGIGVATRGIIREWGDRRDGPPVSHDVAPINDNASLVRTEDGGTVILYDSEYLEKLEGYYQKMVELGLDPVLNPAADPTSPIIVDDPLTTEQSADVEKNAEAWGALTNPMSLIIIGAIVIGIFMVKKKK